MKGARGMIEIKNNKLKRIISIMICIIIMFNSASCSNEAPNPKISKNDSSGVAEEILTENIEIESEEVEKIINEVITEEIYLEEIVEVENKISEALLSEETIEEVLTCKTIYVSEENIDDFSENSQVSGLFGEDVDVKPVLKKVAVGTGVILTLTVLKRVGLREPIASIVTCGAEKSLEYGRNGAIIGSLFGAFTGAADSIDESGRTSAIIGFAAATAGVIITALSLIAEAPSGGSSTVTLAQGIKLCLAGVDLISASMATAYAGKNVIETFQSTDSTDIDWGNIDWEQVGESAVKKSIENAADGYMLGSIIGAVHGGVEGYEFYHKYNAPYSKREARYQQTPKDGNGGHWEGERGESKFVLDEPIELDDGTKITEIEYKNCIPDFSKYSKAEIKIPNMTNSRTKNFNQADEILAKLWTKTKFDGKTWSAREVKIYRQNNGLTWHEMNNMESMQLVPSEVNSKFGHLGGVGEYNAMIGEEEF
ncbi:MAG TPA: hypothetical protein DCW44_02275 [Eubacterium sp.]|nr:hypothetical protein [Eubacterium sp.]